MDDAHAPWLALIVEDDALIRADIVDEFLRRGWIVIDTASGEDAVELGGRYFFHVMFTDIQLCGRLKGWDVADRLRRSARHASLPIVYTSGNPPDRDRQVAGSLFFDKPYMPSDVVDACHRLASVG
jgi:CheY-like chemotaxis protein